MEKPKSNPPKPAVKPAVPAVAVKVAPMFRPTDWLTLALTFGVVWIVYLFTLAPEQTLEDSGELCTGAFYAGIPHPPGYPFWSVYAWFWTAILPFGHLARLRRVHVERISGDQPHFRFRRAVADRGDRVHDALDVCAATAPLPLSGDASLRRVRNDSPDAAVERRGH